VVAFLTWLYSKITQVTNIVVTWYDFIKYWAVTLFWTAVWFFSTLLNKTAYQIAVLQANTKKVVLDWYSDVSYWVNTAKVKLKDAIDWWWDKAKKLAKDWYSYFDWYVNTVYTALKDFKDNWLTGAKLIATTWKDYLDWYVNTVYTALKDFKDNWLAGAKLIATTWKDYLDWYVNTVYTALKDFKDNWLAGAKIIATTWYDGIRLLVTLWLEGIRLLVTQLLNEIQWLTGTAFPFLLDLINNLYATLATLARSYSGSIVSFFDDPLNMILAMLESVIWKWAEWLLAVLLGGVNVEPPPRPDFGGGAPPGGPPPGPGPGTGQVIWPVSSRRISGYRFENPPGHHGVDIGVALGDAVWSCRDGTVTFAGWDTTGYGNKVDVQHTGGWWSRYGHLQYIYVHAGQTVRQGQTLATGDNTGNSTGNHLHLEIRYNGAYVDPLTVMD
jgi:hypothetical protein